jgi:protein-tyrosine-phosphatase
MAEGIMKKFYGTGTYVQSVGVKGDLEIDGFAIAVCQEIGVELSRHRSRSFEQLEQWGDALSSFDLIVALTPSSRETACQLTRVYHLEVDYWPIFDPSGQGESRETKLDAYRKARDEIVARLIERWGPIEGG